MKKYIIAAVFALAAAGAQATDLKCGNTKITMVSDKGYATMVDVFGNWSYYHLRVLGPEIRMDSSDGNTTMVLRTTSMIMAFYDFSSAEAGEVTMPHTRILCEVAGK